MAASRAAHPLAEAIADLAAPPLAPSYLRVQLHGLHGPCLALILHVHPRPRAAGLEVAVLSGNTTEGQPEVTALHAAHGQLFAPAPTSAGLQAFAEDLIAVGAWGVDANTGEPWRLCLPASQHLWSSCWHNLELALASPQDVTTSRAPAAAGGAAPGAGPAGGAGAGGGLHIRFPDFYGPWLAQVQLRCKCAEYAHEQAMRKRMPAARLQPDSDEVYEATYSRLREADMQRLTDSLTTMLRYAARYRGALPAEAPAPVAGGGGGGGGASAAAGGA